MAGSFTTFNVLEFRVNDILSVNSTFVDFGNVSVNSSTLFINIATVGVSFSSGKTLIGNSTSNSTINSTALTIINNTSVANYGVTEMTLTDGDLTFKINSTSFNITNVGGTFFTTNATNIRLGVTGNLANLTPTRLELGNGTTFISPTGLSIAGGATTMNSTHLDVDTITTMAITANFTGNATKLDIFGSGHAGLVNATTADANTVLRSDGQWVKPGTFLHASGRGDLNQPNLDLFWNGVEYSKIEVSGWLRPNNDINHLQADFSHDGSTFTGFFNNYHEHRLTVDANGDTSSNVDNASDAEVAIVRVSNGLNAGMFFFMDIHQHHGVYSTVQIKSGYRDSLSDDGVVSYRGFVLISNTNPIQGMRLRFVSGNVRDYAYAIKIYPT